MIYKYPMEKYAMLDYKHQSVINYLCTYGKDLFQDENILDEVVEILCNYDFEEDIDVSRAHMSYDIKEKHKYKIYLIDATCEILLDKKLNVTPREYFSLDYDNQLKISRYYYNNHKYIFPTLPVDGKIKKIVKRNK